MQPTDGSDGAKLTQKRFLRFFVLFLKIKTILTVFVCQLRFFFIRQAGNSINRRQSQG